MNTLGRVEDLPKDYRDALTSRNLVPLWPSLRALLPAGQPLPRTRATHWPYDSLRPLLMQAGELTPIEKAERRVLVLANPGHGLEKMQATAAIYLGLQLLLPGERAPAHRHTPNAVRMVVEGEGAYTTVDGEELPMSRGDLILTSTGLWHEHGHRGDKPVVWLDVLDLPLVHYLEASYHVDGPSQPAKPERALHRHGGIVPTTFFERGRKDYSMLRYPWATAREALETLAHSEPDLEAVQVAYVNPETGADAQKILGYYALMLRPGQLLTLPARSPASVFHLIDGAASLNVGQERFDLRQADTCCAPGYTEVDLANRSADTPAFLFLVDEAPLHRKLGLYERRS